MLWIRPKSQKKTVNKFHLLKFCARCFLLRVESFFCSLDVLYGGLGISKLQNFQLYLFSMFGRQHPRTVSGSGFTRKNAGSGFNESGSTTLVLTIKSCWYQPVPNSLFTFRRPFSSKKLKIRRVRVFFFLSTKSNQRSSNWGVGGGGGPRGALAF